MKRLILVIFTVIMFLGGCECTSNHYNLAGYNECGEYNSFYDIGRTETYVTKVISEPPGARIELDNDYIGDAPLEIQWEGYPASGCLFHYQGAWFRPSVQFVPGHIFVPLSSAVF